MPGRASKVFGLWVIVGGWWWVVVGKFSDGFWQSTSLAKKRATYSSWAVAITDLSNIDIIYYTLFYIV